MQFIDRGLPVPHYLTNADSHGATLAQNALSGSSLATTGAHAQRASVPVQPEPKEFTVHQSVEDIIYAPEDALKEGLGMVRTLKANLKKLELGSKLRKDVWLREIERWVHTFIK